MNIVGEVKYCCRGANIRITMSQRGKTNSMGIEYALQPFGRYCIQNLALCKTNPLWNCIKRDNAVYVSWEGDPL